MANKNHDLNHNDAQVLLIVLAMIWLLDMTTKKSATSNTQSENPNTNDTESMHPGPLESYWIL